MTMDGQKFCLKWDGFQSSVTSLFDSLRQVEELVDITLCCEGHQVRAHRMMLSACSPYFRDLLKNKPCQQMVIFLKDTSAADLNAVIEFIYKGSVNVAQTQLASFIKTAEMLQIRGLSGEEEKAAPAPAPSPRRAPAAAAATPPHKRRRLSGSDYPSRHSPASPGHRPRSPASPPGPGGPSLPPPPPPPPAHAANLQDMSMDPAATMEHHAPPPPPQHQEPVKVEKIDLTEEEDEASLDSTLCHVAEYEGTYDGSNQGGLEQMPILSAAELGGLPPLGAGPSQQQQQPRQPHTGGGPPGEDGASSGTLMFSCALCNSRYGCSSSLKMHMKKHRGETGCYICGRVFSMKHHLKRHLINIHGIPPERLAPGALAPE